MPSISKKAQSMPASPIRKLVPFSDAAKAKGIEVFHLNDQDECPELIDNRKQLFALYKIEKDKIRLNEQILQTPNLPQAVIDIANEVINLSNKSINELKSLNKPFSGMLVAQI